MIWFIILCFLSTLSNISICNDSANINGWKKMLIHGKNNYSKKDQKTRNSYQKYLERLGFKEQDLNYILSLNPGDFEILPLEEKTKVIKNIIGITFGDMRQQIETAYAPECVIFKTYPIIEEPYKTIKPQSNVPITETIINNRNYLSLMIKFISLYFKIPIEQLNIPQLQNTL